MTPTGRALPGDATLQDAAKVMTEDDVVAVLVRRSPREWVVVTVDDVVERGTRGPGPAVGLRAADLCPPTAVLRPDDQLDAAGDAMRAAHSHAAPVVKGGTVLGFLALRISTGCDRGE